MRKWKLAPLGVLTFLTAMPKSGAAPAVPPACRALFEESNDHDASVLQKLRESNPILRVGEAPQGSSRELLLRFFAGLPLPLNLPLNTEKLIGLQAKTGESRPGIPKFWSSPFVIGQVLDLAGPFGPLGPLGFRSGPIGDSPLHPSFWWMRAVSAGVWSFAPRALFEAGGPLNSKTGVLSAIGPDASDWAQGNFSVLGTNSFAGPKGILGALGEFGAVPSIMDAMLDNSGFYFDPKTHEVVRNILMPFGQDERSYEIATHLKQGFSEKASKEWLLGTNYAADASLKYKERSKSFRSTAQASELVSAVVVPDIGYSQSEQSLVAKRLNFTIRVVTPDGTELVKSDLKEKVNLVQFQVRQGEKFEIQVISQGDSYLGQNQNFRLIMTPASSYYSTFLWERILGPRFEDIFKDDKKNNDAVLTYLWFRIMYRSFSKFKDDVRAGRPAGDQVAFWRETMKQSLEDYQGLLRKASAPTELNKLVLTESQATANAYQKVITEQPLTGAEMMKMWQDLMSNSALTKEDRFGLTPEQAAQIPKNWLSWMNQKLQTIKAGSVTPPGNS